MKNLFILSTAAAISLAFASSANAQTIGVQFAAYYFQPFNVLDNGTTVNLTAGAIPQANWNVAEGGTGTGDGLVLAPITNANLIDTVPPLLMTSTSSTPSDPVTFSLSGATTERGTGSNSFSSQGDKFLFGGNAFNTGGGVSLNLGGLTATDNYTLYAYIGTDYYFYSGQTVAVTLGGTTDYLVENSTLGSYVQATSGDSSTPSLANYAAFTLTGAQLNTEALTVSYLINGTMSGGAGLAGFQLVDDGSAAIPEPSAIWLLALGLLGIGFFVRRNRASA